MPGARLTVLAYQRYAGLRHLPGSPLADIPPNSESRKFLVGIQDSKAPERLLDPRQVSSSLRRLIQATDSDRHRSLKLLIPAKSLVDLALAFVFVINGGDVYLNHAPQHWIGGLRIAFTA